MGQEQLQAMLEKLGSVGVLMPALALLAGLVLLVLGSKLARPMCVFSGLVLGGVGGLILGEALADQGGIVLAMVIGTAIAGALLSGLLFRVWMAISGALIFGLAASGAALLWQAPPEAMSDAAPQANVTTLSESDENGKTTIHEQIGAVTDQFRDNVTSAMTGDEESGAPATISFDETAQKVGAAILDALRGMSSYYLESLKAWWAEAGSGAKGGMMLIGLVAAVIGLLLGLIGPYKAASVQSAVAGSVLILFSSFSLLAQLMPEHLDWLPATPRRVLICLSLITAAGLALQWTIFKRKTDK